MANLRSEDIQRRVHRGRLIGASSKCAGSRMKRDTISPHTQPGSRLFGYKKEVSGVDSLSKPLA